MLLLRCVAVSSVIGTALVLSSCAQHLAESKERHIEKVEALAASWEPVPPPVGIAATMPELPTKVIRFESTEGTWMNVDVSPDGETIVFDLLGDLYHLPIDGGDAVPITSGKAWDQAPRFSPDGTQIYFISDREGAKNLWRLTLADQSVTQITKSGTDVLGGPNWSQDKSRLLVGVSARNVTAAEVVLHVVDPLDGVLTPINPTSETLIDHDTRQLVRHRQKAYSGIESSDGKVFFSESQPTKDYLGSVTRLFAFDRESQTLTTITRSNELYHEHKPQLSNDGRLISYFRQYSEHRTELRILNRITGEDDLLLSLTNAEYAAYVRRSDSRPNYAFTPDDQSLVFWHAGKIRRVALSSGSMEVIPFRVAVEREVTVRLRPSSKQLDDEAATIRWPSLSLDGQTMVFSAFGYIWVMDLPMGRAKRLSRSGDFEYMPAISPDGQSVAYISFSSSRGDYGSGRLMVADLEGRNHREVLADPHANYLMPRWSHDGSMIALIREADRATAADEAVFGWTSVSEGVFREVMSVKRPRGPANLFVYARHVSFSTTGDKLLFSYPRSGIETVLVAADLDGKYSRVLAVGASEIGGITPAPNLKHLALTRRDGAVWIVPFDVAEDTTIVSTSTLDARRTSRNAGYYLDWSNSEQLTFGLGKRFYRYSLGDNELQSLPVIVRHTMSSVTQPLVFTGARLITMSGGVVRDTVIESGTLVVAGARITAIGPTGTVAIPANAQVIDATGKTIMPGFLDTHYHSMLAASGLVLPASDIDDPTAIMFGITSAWNAAGQVDDGDPATADLQKAERVIGPRLSYVAGPAGRPYEFLTSYSAALTTVEQKRDLGVSVLKEYNVPTRQQRRWLAAAAYESGLGIVSHLETFDGTMTRVVDGYTGGDHPSLPDSFYRDVSELLRQTAFIWTPNVVIVNTVTGAPADKEIFHCDAVVYEQMRGNLETLTTNAVCDSEIGSPTVPYGSHRISRIAKSVAVAAKNGVTVGVSAHNKPGSNLHREMWYLWKGGMSVESVLQAAIGVNARKLGLQEELGTLEVGKVADFLVLEKNPLDNLLHTLSLKHTVQGGVVYESAIAAECDSRIC